jgi:hypothetical protein
MNRRAWPLAFALCAVVACAGPTDHAVAAVQSVSDDGRILTLTINSCGTNATINVVESADRVVLRARGGKSHNDCADGAVVTLREPLGDRVVIDATTDRPVRMPANRS